MVGSFLPIDKQSRPPLSRMLIIHSMLQANRFPNRRSMAQILDTSEKTIQRDIDFMRDRMNLPIQYNSLKYGYHYTEPVKHFPYSNVSKIEIVALFLAQKSLDLKGTLFEEPLKTAFLKLTTNLQDAIAPYSLKDLDRIYSFRAQGFIKPADTEIFKTLSCAILYCKSVEFLYRKLTAKEYSKRKVHPYHLACIQNKWYLFGYDVDRQEIRTFALPRILQVSQTEEGFDFPYHFSITKHLRDSFGVSSNSGAYLVRIWFDPLAAQLIRERVWHHSQRIRELRGGSLELSMRLGSLTEVKRWILSYGAHARVLYPPELIERLKVDAKTLCKHYCMSSASEKQPLKRNPKLK